MPRNRSPLIHPERIKPGIRERVARNYFRYISTFDQYPFRVTIDPMDRSLMRLKRFRRGRHDRGRISL